MSEHTAIWSISLDTECPKCGYGFDLTETCPDMFIDHHFDLAEHDTDRTRDIEVDCPECGYEFKVDLEY